MKIRNFTGHDLNFPHVGLDMPSEGNVKTQQVPNIVGTYEGICVYDLQYVSISGLPEPEEGSVFVVSAISLNAIRELMPHRTDVLAVHKPIKNAQGQTVAASALRTKG